MDVAKYDTKEEGSDMKFEKINAVMDGLLGGWMDGQTVGRSERTDASMFT